jgi:hypothetical protein
MCDALLKKLEILIAVWFKLGKQPGLIHVGEARVKRDGLLERSRVRHRNRSSLSENPKFHKFRSGSLQDKQQCCGSESESIGST